jgi:ribosomal protein L40E
MKVPCFFSNAHNRRLLAVASLVIGCCLPVMAAQDSGRQGLPTVETTARPVVEECRRCHDVEMYQFELKNSVHAFDRNKKEISCEQCHHFHFNPLTSYYARDEYYDKKIFAPGAFDRRKMQANARNSIKAEKCRACHQDLYRNTRGEPISEIGRLSHDAFLGKNGETRRTCAGCHINTAHLPEFDRGLLVNARFADKIMENQPGDADRGGRN